MAFRVEVSPKAEQDTEAILEWLIFGGNEGCRSTSVCAVETAIDSLPEMPRRCELADGDA